MRSRLKEMNAQPNENWNVGKPWSAMDVFHLKNSLAHGSSVKKIAEFLMRRESEVREKMVELGIREKKPDGSHERR